MRAGAKGSSPFTAKWFESSKPVTLPRVMNVMHGLGFVTQDMDYDDVRGVGTIHAAPRGRAGRRTDPEWLTARIGVQPRYVIRAVPVVPVEAPEAVQYVCVELPVSQPESVPEPVAEVMIARRAPRLKEIAAAVEFETGIGTIDILSHRRAVPIVRARMMVAFIASVMTTRSSPQIGNFMDRDHSTVLHAINKVKAGRSRFEPELSRAIAALEAVEP